MMLKTQKVTTHIPRALLKDAQSVTGLGITGTIKLALEKLAMEKNYKALLALRGQRTYVLDISELRKDRDEK